MPTLQTYKKMSDVEALAEFAHRNQFDKAGEPYFKHPYRVMEMMRDQGAPPYVQMAAVLHDVTEDTAFTTDMLMALGVPEAAVQIVRLLDRTYSKVRFTKLVEVSGMPDVMTADEYYYANIMGDSWARAVKLADISDNTKPWRLSYLPVETQDRLKAKYAKAHNLLGVR